MEYSGGFSLEHLSQALGVGTVEDPSLVSVLKEGGREFTQIFSP